MIKKATHFSFFLLILIAFLSFENSVAKADSDAACAIWLCLPAGFPGSECSAAHGEFKHRIKKGKPPLPNLAGCSSGPNGGYSTGNYKMGYEPFVPCKSGYTLKTINRGYGRGNQTGICYANTCANRIYTPILNDYRCTNYVATPRPKPSFVKMWVDGKYLGQFFY